MNLLHLQFPDTYSIFSRQYFEENIYILYYLLPLFLQAKVHLLSALKLYWAGKKFKLFGLPKNEQERKSIINSCSSHTYVGGAPAKCFGVFVYDNWEFKEDYPWK